MNIKNTVPSERNQSQKTTYCMIPFLRNARIGKPLEIKRLLVAEGRQGREHNLGITEELLLKDFFLE